ncbi:hypothetical protein GCM10010123_08860 [Pilimelia anulata]|uniref:TIGR04222 domain-containing membrane protein n=1 Tax=Pilimelia anulata TaxID=53371 RepID=A0A8J3B4S5_9ACTN|nr:TIGR04222 domain-containing membrane protein [Pilimelia anulata]GGJ81280.1 hypothetical protein GCM10010123_08860 [Pilimelia anulata]
MVGAAVLASERGGGAAGPVILGLLVLLVVGVLAHRRAVLRRIDTPATLPDPGTLAMVGGGPRRALAAALARLRVDGAIGASDDDGRLGTFGATPVGLSAVERAVHAAAGRGTRIGELWRDPAVAAALEQSRQRVYEQGLLLDPPTRRRLRLAAALPIAAGVAAVAVAVATAGGGLATVGLVLAGALTAIVGVVLVAGTPRVTRAGRELLARARTSNTHLRPALTPAFDTYGGAAAAVAVGLYGPAALVAIDPTLVGLVPRQGAANPGYTYGGTGSGCGVSSCGSSSGGGHSGGHSGGCGGGSSCGGGSCGGGGGCGGGGS